MPPSELDADTYVKVISASKDKPPIPPMPETFEEFKKLLDKPFKVISEGNPVSISGGGYGTGGSSATAMVLRCLNCTYEFDAIESYGCFSGGRTPYDCPNCGFPTKLLFGFPLTHRPKKGA